ncbi:helix-turn-helix domain-containing protein [Runella zeae]|uniref:helix-turn-helix domain-containing protein n=1 Tax=Runella zeae TaxID=94255 RepID=UPI0023567E6C|nr:AraC family transcriptional regulator [Runella zeae]
MKEKGNPKDKAKPIAFSCYYQNNREGENYVEYDTLQYQVSGSLMLFDGKETYPSQKGGLRLVRRNHLMKFFKKPDEKQPFQSLSIYLHLDFLKAFALELDIKPDLKNVQYAPVINLAKNNLLENYLQSVQAYAQTDELQSPAMADAKLREGLLLVLKSNPEIVPMLFDFSEPYKIDLRNFMEQNFAFNVQLGRFAYLTGRSLATFKRDFMEEFGISPGRWLTQRRLQEAYRILKHTGKTASEIYIDMGFEDLSHFSHAFKRKYGVAPSNIEK